MKVNILVIGRHEDITQTVVRLANSEPGWHAVSAYTDEDAMQIFKTNQFDIVLIGGGVDNISEESLVKEFKLIRPSIKIVRHFGGGSGLLFNEIQEALRSDAS